MDFWESPQGAAIYKHAVLREYAPTYASKVGKYSPNNRVEIIDGYAGPGQYANGDPGSPMVFLQMAQLLAKNRRIHCTFIEEDPTLFARLKANLAQAGIADGTATLLPGTMSQHLDAVLHLATGVPVFAFIDPFGLGLPFDELVGKLMGRDGGRSTTEVLVNFIRPAVFRLVGYLQPHTENITQLRSARSKVADVNRSLGGTWWQPLARSLQGDELLIAIREGYVQRLLAAAGSRWRVLQVSVADRKDFKPVYDLLFFSRHLQGPWFFNDALSHARSVFEMSTDPNSLMRLELFTPEGEWESEIATNLRRLVEQKGNVSVLDDMVEVYGSVLGVARSKHVKAAASRLVEQGFATGDVKKEPYLIKLIARPIAAVS